jgi:hypothetical protein
LLLSLAAIVNITETSTGHFIADSKQVVNDGDKTFFQLLICNNCYICKMLHQFCEFYTYTKLQKLSMLISM